MRYIDLHTHTEYSDGYTVTPRILAESMALKGVSIAAKTDHDTLRGNDEFAYEAAKFGITPIHGVEISTNNYHLLALNKNKWSPQFQKFIEYSESLQLEGSKQRIRKLQEAGYPITLQKIRTIFPNARIGKVNIGVAMMLDPACRERLMREYPGKGFNDIRHIHMGNGGIAGELEGILELRPEEAIEAVHAAGGIIGIAHPVIDVKEMREMEELKRKGIDFMEIQPQLRKKYDYAPFEKFAKENGLPFSYGSDYHGASMERILLNNFPESENTLSPELAALLKI
jgi:predicted metal-dependent phosphoesterase TrpH